MRLDAAVVRYLSEEDLRVLKALESAMFSSPPPLARTPSTALAKKDKKHRRIQTQVPLKAICTESRMRPGGCRKVLFDLARRKLVSVDHSSSSSSKLDNPKKIGGGDTSGEFRLTYAGFDALALQEMADRETVVGVGRKVGVGKESDIYLGNSGSEAKEVALKFHRLGRTSFRSVKNNRDYFPSTAGGDAPGSEQGPVCWLWMSKLAASREYAFMCALHAAGLPVPKPVDHSRHLIAMEYIGGASGDCMASESESARLLANVRKDDIRAWIEGTGIGYEQMLSELYDELMQDILDLAGHGLIHGDFNEFNLMLRLPLTKQASQQGNERMSRFVMIDFPQMISTKHPEAQRYFARDINGIRTFFARRFGFRSGEGDGDQDAEEESDVEGEDSSADSTIEQSGKVEALLWNGVRVVSQLDAEVRASGWKGIVNGIVGISKAETSSSASALDSEEELDESDASTDKEES